MKILYVIQRYRPASLTGSEVVISTIAEAIAQTDNEVSLVTSDTVTIKGFYDPNLTRLPAEESLKGLNVRRLQTNWFVGSVCFVLAHFFPFLNRLTGGAFRFLSFGPHLISLEQVIREEEPDLIHTGPMPLYHVWATWRIAKQLHVPLVITPMMHFDVAMFHNPLIYRILGEAQGVITFTQFEKKQLVAQGVQEEMIQVIPATYIDTKDFSTGKSDHFRTLHHLTDEPIVLFLGTKAFDKGAIHLLEIWPKVRKTIPHATLVLAGLSTTQWQNERAKQSSEGIIDLEYIAGKEKHDLLAAATVVCVPSRTESFGIVVPEAWAKGKPVIGGPTGATRELIEEGKDGYTVEFGDTGDLAAKIIGLLKDPAKSKTMGEAGKLKAKQMTQEVIVKKTLAVYQKALKQKSGV